MGPQSRTHTYSIHVFTHVHTHTHTHTHTQPLGNIFSCKYIVRSQDTVSDFIYFSLVMWTFIREFKRSSERHRLILSRERECHGFMSACPCINGITHIGDADDMTSVRCMTSATWVAWGCQLCESPEEVARPTGASHTLITGGTQTFQHRSLCCVEYSLRLQNENQRICCQNTFPIN